MSSERVAMSTHDPDSYAALTALAAAADRAARTTGLDELLLELVRIRVSQLNGCAFCLRLHTRDALRKGEHADRLAVLPAWRESQYFSAEEQAALALAEDVTLLARGPAADIATDTLDAAQTSAVAWVATVMNAFNRVAVTSGYRVAPD